MNLLKVYVPIVLVFVASTLFSQAAEGEGFILSKNSDFSTDDRDFNTADILYILLWSDKVDFNKLKKTEYEIEDANKQKFKGKLTNHFDGTYTTSVPLAYFASGKAKVKKIKVEDKKKKKFEVKNVSITISESPSNNPLKGFILSKNDDFSTDDRDFNTADILYILLWSDKVDFNKLKKTEYEIEDANKQKFKGKLTNHFDGTYTTSVPLAYFASGKSKVKKIKVEDDKKKKFEVKDVSITISEQPSNNLPVAKDDAATTNEDTPVTIDVLANDNDPESEPLSVSAVTQGTNGTVVNNSTKVTYTPASDFHGTDSFTYTANDGTNDSNIATVIVTVQKANQAPNLVNPISDLTLTVGGADFETDLNSIFSDPDGDSLNYLAKSSDLNIAAAEIAGNLLTISPGPEGNAVITVIAYDNISGFDSTMFSVRVINYPSSFEINTTVQYAIREEALDYNANEYRIIGLPGASNRAVVDFLSGEHNENWQVYWDNGAAEDFLIEFDGSDIFRFSTGRAFWIINKGPLNINTSVTTAPLNTVGEVEIPLHTGFNLIANPFTTPINWSEIQQVNDILEPIWAFDGTFSQSVTFEPFVGYYHFNESNLASLKIPFALTLSPSTPVSDNTYHWQVKVKLISGDFIDNSMAFGVSSKATLGFDSQDFHKPRAIAPMPAAYFDRPDWDADYRRFSLDIRSAFAESEIWEFEVEALEREKAVLQFQDIEKIPQHYEIYLIQENRGEIVNLRENPSYQFTPKFELTGFRVVVGEADVVEEHLSSVAPKDFLLEQNYPNPFNPSTTIPVAIPIESEVNLSVYNLLGQKVKSLYSGTLGSGRYLYKWDGRDENGKQVSSGIYLYRLRTSKNVTFSEKMVLSK